MNLGQLGFSCTKTDITTHFPDLKLVKNYILQVKTEFLRHSKNSQKKIVKVSPSQINLRFLFFLTSTLRFLLHKEKSNNFWGTQKFLIKVRVDVPRFRLN